MKSKALPLATSQIEYCFTNLTPHKTRDQMNICGYFTVKEKPNLNALEKAFNYIIEEQAALRLRYRWTLRGPRQYTKEYEYYHIPVVEVADEKALSQKMIDTHETNGAFSGKNLYDATIYTYDNKATLYMRFNHFCFDATSFFIVIESLKKYYGALSLGEEPIRNTKIVSWEKIVEADLKHRKSDRYRQQKLYWKARFHKKPYYASILPFPRILSPLNENEIVIDGDVYKQIKMFSTQNGISLGYVMVVCASIAFNAMTGKNKFGYMIIHHNRMTCSEKNTIGPMSPSLFHLVTVENNNNVLDCARSNYLNYLEDYKNGKVSSVAAVEKSIGVILGKLRFLSLLHSISITTNNLETNDDLYKYGIIPHKYQPMAIYDYLADNGVDKMTITTGYQIKAIRKDKVERFSNIFVKVVEKIAENPNQTIAELINTL